MKTRIILREDIPALGHVGDVVDVAAGYARNHLIPCGRAFPYSEEGLRRVARARKEAELRRAAERAEHEALASRIAALQVTFEEKVSPEGHLYGSVNAHRIAEALAAQGIELSVRSIRLEEPIRETGEYQIPVHVHGEVEAMLRVWVVQKQEAEA